ncbi:MAG TPA: CRISPR-associated endonuclease Cas2 [Kiritimatiellia bacterium]|nr:CRISPR-associated endonuclease Cas2 [Kiritimatiellia bacterium]
MWILVMFDLPVDTDKAKRQYVLFRKFLLQDGFTKLQFSVYVRHCASEENMQVHLKRIEAHIPPDGEVRSLWLTEKQFARMRTFLGKRRKPAPSVPQQLEFF